MSLKTSTAGRKTTKKKPNKPRKDFPLFAHIRGYWCKKIKGKQWNFGPWDDPDAALQKYLDWNPHILAGRDPRALGPTSTDANGFTIQQACNYFLSAKEIDRDNGDITPRTFKEYFEEAKRVCEALGRITAVETLTPNDFRTLRQSYPETWGPKTIDGHIVRTKTIFNYCNEDGLLKHPVAFGNGFRQTSRKQHKRKKQQKKTERGSLEFNREQLRQILDNSDSWLKACTLLGIQAGFGNSDCAQLTTSVVDFESGWIDYGRGKTGTDRRFPMWPETVAAIKEALTKRPIAKQESHDSLCFLTSHGFPLVHESVKEDMTYSRSDNITERFGKLLKKLEIHRPDVNFYSLRRTFSHVAQDAGDSEARNYVMGHVDSSMAAHYQQTVSSPRIEHVVAFVHDWLFG